jgi:hypothetical protein
VTDSLNNMEVFINSAFLDAAEVDESIRQVTNKLMSCQ